MQHDAKPSERRKHHRRPLTCAVSCLPGSGDGVGCWWEGVVVDVSRGGLSIISERWFEEKEILKLKLGGVGEATAVTAIVRIVRARARPSGNWLLGCQFVPELSEEELELLVHRSDAPADEMSGAT
jgi:hypothetical protein